MPFQIVRNDIVNMSVDVIVNAANFHADSHGTKLNYEVISEAVSSLRANRTLDKKWKSKIDDDFLSRDNKGR